MLTALSLQLALYAIAWFLIGLAFGLVRQAVMAWSFAWGILASVAATLANPDWALTLLVAHCTNTLVVLAFVLLLLGCSKAYREPVNPMHIVLPLLGAIVVDVMCYQWFAETTSVRIMVFSVCVTWPILQSVIRLMRALKGIGFARLSVLVWLPGLILVCFFVLRAYRLSGSMGPDNATFAAPNALDQAEIVLFFISLGAFNFAQAAFVIGRMVRRLRDLSETDQLTRLANRRTLMRHMTVEDARLRRTGRGYAVLMLDLDHFKKVNDAYGHQAGDLALKAFADTVKGEIRANDLLARYGGEEFLLLLPETNLEAAVVLANRIRERVMTQSIALATQTVKVTTSVGVAISAKDETHFEEVIKRADEALYQAKAQGRNCIVVNK